MDLDDLDIFIASTCSSGALVGRTAVRLVSTLKSVEVRWKSMEKHFVSRLHRSDVLLTNQILLALPTLHYRFRTRISRTMKAECGS